MAYGSYSGDNLPANSRTNIESDGDQNLPMDNFDREETQFDSQGNIVSTIPSSPGGTGEIQFRRDIYSPIAFKQKVDTSFSELNNQSQIDIPTFFKEYNRLFFDIPKQGANSHETIINESRAYFQDYQDPKDSTIAGLNAQINDLNLQITALQAASLDSEGVSDIQDTINIGNPFDPNINWDGSFEENGLRKTFRRIYENTVYTASFDTGFINNQGDLSLSDEFTVEDLLNNFSNSITIDLESNADASYTSSFNSWSNSQIKKDIFQAYERGRGGSGGREFLSTRTYSEWKQDIIRESSGNSKKDALKMLDYLAAKITNDPNTFL